MAQMDYYGNDSSTDSGDDPVDLLDESGNPISDLYPDEESIGSGHDHEEPGTSTEVATSGVPAMSPRAYQYEMLEASLKQNVIVAMDTGSGKTQVAVLRIREETERSQKLVWFLVPTVELAHQQFAVVKSQIPGVQSKLLLGSDNVDKWAGPHVWEEFLTNVRIVVSTFQILFDALEHAMIPLSALGLIVFDEAHNCTRKNCSARLMREIYWPAKQNGLPVPHILGLTASPIMRSHLKGLEVLEQTLDAVCRSPNKHREELIAHVKRPEMHAVPYGKIPPLPHPGELTPNMRGVKRALDALDINADPRILKLMGDKSTRGQETLRVAYLKNDTYTQKRMRSFNTRSTQIYQNLGPWAADYYVHRVVSEFLAQDEKQGLEAAVADGWGEDEHQYLSGIIKSIPTSSPSLDELYQNASMLSTKVRELLKTLDAFPDEPMGVVFAKERYSVSILAHLLSVHPLTKGRYRVAAMVGSSTVPGRRADFLDLGHKDDLNSLNRFRSGVKNLLISTSVLEEGIDVPVCNLVVCFDLPANLKSFIQSRGRARMRSSKLYLLFDDDSTEMLAKWQDLEEQMKKKYVDDMREVEELEAIEDSETASYPPYIVPSTGARMTLDDAKSNLERFCAALTSRKFVNSSPYYITKDADDESRPITTSSIIRAAVFLPISVDIRFRNTRSLHNWKTEKRACQDAAFQAYVKLHKAGLVTDHLTPLKDSGPERIDQRRGTMEVREQISPWLLVAQAWQESSTLHRRRLAFTSEDGAETEDFYMVLPVPVPCMDAMTLYWDSNTSWTIQMDHRSDKIARNNTGLGSVPDHTPALLSLAYGYRMTDEGERQRVASDRNIVSFVSTSVDLTLDRVRPRKVDMSSFHAQSQQYLVRQPSNNYHPYFFMEYLLSKPPITSVRHPYQGFEDSPENVPYVALKNWPKKAGFFQPVHSGPDGSATKPDSRVLPAQEIVVDNVPSIFSKFGLMIPSISHALGAHLVAADLIENHLAQIGLSDLTLVLTALTASKARAAVNYEKLEFLGDALLKYCTTVHCSARYPIWPEGYLSHEKDKIVSNARLCKASVAFGLDRYIIANPLNLQKWRPTYAQDLIASPPEPQAKREMSTKTLADVVEALIGATFVNNLDGDGNADLSRVVECIRLFLPKEPWKHPDQERLDLYNNAPDGMVLPEPMRPLEELIGYQFKKKSLLVEAMTHASYNRPDTHASFERLEFLGDAILEYLVVRKLFFAKDAAGRPIPHSKMHLLKTALVNSDFLGLLILEWSVKQPRVDVVLASTHGPRHAAAAAAPVEYHRSEEEFAIWRFMRHLSPEMGILLQQTAARHQSMRDALRHAIKAEDRYPWAALARLQAQKVFSDLFESVLGAVWVDSGSLEECEALLERVGILWYMQRMLADGVHVLHPKEELGHAAESERVTYEDEVKTLDDGSREHFCRVLVGTRCVAEVSGGVSREEARTRAAQEALVALGR